MNQTGAPMPNDTDDARDHRLSLLYSTREKRMLEAIAKREGISASDVVRRLIREKYAQGGSDGDA